MHVHICIPYRTDKNLGKAYNDTMRLIPDGDWACFLDYDVQLLTPDAGLILHKYAEQNPFAGLLTAYCNRLSQLNKTQVLNNTISDDPNILNHIAIANERKKDLYKVTAIDKDISGFLMMVNKSTWNVHPFPETGKCLGVDTVYGRRLRVYGYEILRMEGLYAFHAYRIATGLMDKSHLQ